MTIEAQHALNEPGMKGRKHLNVPSWGLLADHSRTRSADGRKPIFQDMSPSAPQAFAPSNRGKPRSLEKLTRGKMKASRTISWRMASRSLPNCPGRAARPIGQGKQSRWFANQSMRTNLTAASLNSRSRAGICGAPRVTSNVGANSRMRQPRIFKRCSSRCFEIGERTYGGKGDRGYRTSAPNTHSAASTMWRWFVQRKKCTVTEMARSCQPARSSVSNSRSRDLLDVHGLSPAFMRSGGIEKVARDWRKTRQEGKIT